MDFILSLAFGFCEYGDPESTLRALRLLHDFKLGEKSLVVSNSCRPLSHSQFPFLTVAWEWDMYLILGEGGCENSQRSVEVHLQKEEYQKELTSRWRVGKSSNLSLVLWYASQPMNRRLLIVELWLKLLRCYCVVDWEAGCWYWGEG